ncbi:MAG: hypothetical protein JNL08_10035 [Planctomycetes bacterium]|nr:hypothetical protein [Planctomycetota bacterium]
MRLAPLASILAVCATATTQAPPGFKTYENKHAPLQFIYPVVFKEMPLPPTEQVEVAKFLLDKTPEELKKVDPRLLKAFTPELTVFRFERALTAPTTGVPAAGDAPEPAGPTTVKEAMVAQSRVGSWEEFVKRFERWELRADPKDPDLFRMSWREGQLAGELPVGYVARRLDGNTVFGVYGFTLGGHEKRFRTQLVKMAESLKLAEGGGDELAAAAIDRLYASGKYRGVEARKAARRAMARGWKALDTENYLIVHHSKSEELIKRIGREIEAMRALYTELFPPVGTMDSVSVVRVCRTAEEYFQYGGPPNSGGYWHPGNEELVFFDYSYTQKTLDEETKKRQGRNKLTNDDSLLVLYHEAFHQYIHYAIGEFSPHDWFNEGYGDYFSGAVLSDTTSRVQRIGPSEWRIHLAKDMCEFGEDFVPLERLLKAERAEFYHPKRAGHYYAAAWSFLYFLKQSDEVKANAKWAALLDTYFNTVKDDYQQRIRQFGENADLGQKMVAGHEARKAALTAALDGIDLVELEAAWKKWVVELKDPWPHLRKKRK